MIRSPKYNKLTSIAICIIWLSILLVPHLGQSQQTLKDGDAKREEIQRYFGYETLMYRYLSIPYDLTMNTNERGDFVDIGFLFLILLPLLFFIRYREKWWVLIGMPLLLLILFIISTSNGFVFEPSSKRMILNQEGQTNYTIDGSVDGIREVIIKTIYNLNNTLYTPFKSISDALSGESDYITYPLVLLLFIGFASLLYFGFNKKSRWYIFLLSGLFLCYIFFWYILSSGIIWYGFIGWILGVICMVLLLPNPSKDTLSMYTSIASYIVIGLWTCSALILRMSNINPASPKASLGKNMVNPVFLQQLVGIKNEKQVLDMFYNNLSNTIRQINRNDDALVYRVGTSFSYFIDNNHKRVFMDNQLGFFRALEKRFPDKQERADVLKANKFKYLIIDLNTPTLDNTPEQSLVDKYNGLIEFVYKNPKVKLLATNRRVKTFDKQGKLTENVAYNVFGKVLDHGTFAIYEIL